MVEFFRGIQAVLPDGVFSLLSFPAVLLPALVLYLICLLLFFRRTSPGKNVAIALLFLYAGALISLSLPPAWTDGRLVTPASTEWAVHSVQWTPSLAFSGFGDWKTLLRSTGADFAVLMPLAVLVPLVNPKFRLGRMLVLSILVSACMEGLQLTGNILAGTAVHPVRADDVIWNVAGCMLVSLLFAGYRRFRSPRHTAKHYRR